jgi:hypothetical protein
MKTSAILILSAFGLGVVTLSASEEPSQADLEFFESKIRPALVKHCYECHSEESGKAKGGLRLDSRAAVLLGGESGPALVAGKPEESLLLAAIKHADGMEMPPSQQLLATEIADFEKWIALGAPDPREGEAKPARQVNLEEERKFWVYQPIATPSPPNVENENWPRDAIDNFVLARMEQGGLMPAPDAEKRTLARRLYFDLTGLPPTPEQMDGFLADRSPTAVETLVDRLLDSQHFGERWGRHWMDVARYAESNGRARNMVWPHAWRYRDWVIEALNSDLPYDEFVRHQLAGDLLPSDSGEDRDRQIVATGFLALGPKSIEEAKPEIFEMDVIDEQINVVSRAFLGLSVSCARCHDHKFDAIPTADYYALAGIFRSTETLYGRGLLTSKVNNDSRLQPIGDRADALAGPAAEHDAKYKTFLARFLQSRVDRYRVQRRLADENRKLGIETDPAAKEELQANIDKMEAEMKEWHATVDLYEEELNEVIEAIPERPDYAMAATESESAADCRIHIRGETTSLGDEVPRGVLQVLQLDGLPPIGASSGRELLAKWITHPDNPLTPRVAVNRIWGHLFGRGLVSTPDDFGVVGARPSHPELLDHLAKQFVDNGWSTKLLIRQIVLSRTYQLSSQPISLNTEVDPDNVLVWRMQPRRLQIESVRDAWLSVSGELQTDPPGPSVLASFHPLKDFEFNSKTDLTPEHLDQTVRSLYLPIVRGKLPEVFDLYDFADPSDPISVRNQTTVPTQSVFILNSPWFIERARLTAQRILAEHEGESAAIDLLYRLALGRPAEQHERERISHFLRQPYEPLPEEADAKKPKEEQEPIDVNLEKWTSVCQSVLGSNEFFFVF